MGTRHARRMGSFIVQRRISYFRRVGCLRLSEFLVSDRITYDSIGFTCVLVNRVRIWSD